MKYIADFHTHSRFSRATSKTLNPENLAFWAQKKGITVVGTGDFTHPAWINELSEKLIEAPGGLFMLKPKLQEAVNEKIPVTCSRPARFLLSGEISCIYKKNGKTRKLHHLILMPSMSAVVKFNKRLERIGNISSDGRPILGLDSKNLLEIALETDPQAFFIPAHIWTPWFSLFGSKSGFDSLEECFEDLTQHIHALETGLSSDPPMNRRLSALDNYILVSNSDAHSPGKLGREANIFDTALGYDHMVQAMTSGIGFSGTIEFFPEEGKYHLDGHRKCNVCLEPEKTRFLKGICPACGRHVTIGVLNRILQLADRKTPKLTKDFISLIPLTEVLSELMKCGPATQKVMFFYEELLRKLGPELKILMDVPLKDLSAAGGPLLAEGIHRIRQNKVIREAGYDGQFGVIRLFMRSEKAEFSGQMALFAEKKPERPVSTEPSPAAAPIPEKPEKTATAKPTDPILGPLNPEQRAAVVHHGGHLLVTAGPGTGKTLTLTHRIAHLIRSGRNRPEQILALTFTRKAANEMKERLTDLIFAPRKIKISVFTFHGFCLDILRDFQTRTGVEPHFTLCSEVDTAQIALEVLERAGKGKRFLKTFLKDLPGIKTARALNISNPSLDPVSLSLYPRYERSLREMSMLDLDDLEVAALKMLQDHPNTAKIHGRKFGMIFVDEYQDTNRLQVEILKALIQAGTKSICAIGDPDQAIYGFRGALLKNFFHFSKDFPGAEEIRLTRNYRSSQCILRGSAALLDKKKPLQCETAAGGPILITSCNTHREEAEMVVEQVERIMGGTSHFSFDSGRVAPHEEDMSLSFSDISVLFRLNAQGDALEEALDRGGIPLVRSGNAPLVNQYPVDVFWRFLQTLRYPGNSYYQRTYAKCLSEHSVALPKGLKTPETENPAEIVPYAEEMHGLELNSDGQVRAIRRLRDLANRYRGDLGSFLDALTLERGIDHGQIAGDRLALMSIHAAKGLEWPVTFITGCEDRLLPCTLFGDRNLEEERRLLYVGMTRARTRLVLSHTRNRVIHGRPLSMKPSPFLETLPKSIQSPLRRNRSSRKQFHRQLTLF